jgi:hypothetical protein
MKQPQSFQSKSLQGVVRVALTLAGVLSAGRASAQTSTDWTYEVGLRTTFMTSEMALSDLGSGFADLPAGGKALPHSSSLFVMFPVGTHVRVGIETLVGNSYPGSDAEILFQGTGIIAEYQTTGTWFAAVGIQAGAMIASASQSTDRGALRAGVHYKESGYFLAPQISLGRRVGRFDLRLVGKPVLNFGAEGLGAFDGVYAGISIARIGG